MGHRIQDLAQRLDETVPLLEHELDRRLSQLLTSLYASGAARDGLERTIDEVDDDAARRELRRLLDELDTRLTEVVGEANRISAYDLFDPIRILSTDLKATSIQHVLW